MKACLLSNIGALVLFVLARVHVGTTSPMKIPYTGLASSESSSLDTSTEADSVLPISPLDAGNGVSTEVKWKGKISIPPKFTPYGIRVKLWIPVVEEGLESVASIIGLMRTVVDDDKTCESLTNFIRRLKEKNILGGKIIIQGSRVNTMKRLMGVELEDRKIMIANTVNAHNLGVWFQPEGDIKKEIEVKVWHPSPGSAADLRRSSKRSHRSVEHASSGTSNLTPSKTLPPRPPMPKVSAPTEEPHFDKSHALPLPIHNTDSTPTTSFYIPTECYDFNSPPWMNGGVLHTMGSQVHGDHIGANLAYHPMDVPPLGQEGQFTGLPIGAPPAQDYHWSTQLMPVVHGTHHPDLMGGHAPYNTGNNNLNPPNGIPPSIMVFPHTSTDYEHAHEHHRDLMGGHAPYNTDNHNLNPPNGIPPSIMVFPHTSTDYEHTHEHHRDLMGGHAPYNTDNHNLNPPNGIPPSSMVFPHTSTDQWQDDTGTNMDTGPF